MSSETIVLRCSGCGAPLDAEGTSVLCPYCGTHLQIGSGDVHARKGIEAYNQGKSTLAVAELERAIELGVTRYEREVIYTVLGNAYDDIGMFDKAIAAHRQALRVNPRHSKAWIGLGIAYRHSGDLDEAERCYSEAMHIEPNDATLLASLGLLYVYRNDPHRAIATLEKAIKRDPSIANAHASLALAYAMAGRFRDADAALKQAVLCGYKNPRDIQERIAALKVMS